MVPRCRGELATGSEIGCSHASSRKRRSAGKTVPPPQLTSLGTKAACCCSPLVSPRIIEQESFDLAVYGSTDGNEWGPKPLAAFPQKFYCGTYSILLDLSDAPDVRFLRVQWKMSRWGRGEPKPLFGFYVFAEKVAEPVAVGAAN